MTKLIWSHVLAVSALTLKIAHIINYQETQTIHVPDCIRYMYIIDAFCYNFKSQTNILLSY